MSAIYSRYATTTAELRTMVKGFELLTGEQPTIWLDIVGKSGMPTGIRTLGGEVLFCTRSYMVQHIGTRYIMVATAEGPVELDTRDLVDGRQMRAAFYERSTGR